MKVSCSSRLIGLTVLGLGLGLVLDLVPAAPVFAAEQPDAGRTVQEMKSAPAVPSASSPVPVELPAAPTPVSGGPKVTLKTLSIDGNTVFSDEDLLSALGDVRGQSYDFAGLKGLTDRITQFYHDHDYPFARAFLPPQSIGGGTLHIRVVEGTYGEVGISDGDSRSEAASLFLSPLKSGELIEGAPLERVSLILDDQPGYSFTPVLRPGKAVGTGDLDFPMVRDQEFGGRVGIDNSGNRYTGRWRAQVDLYANSPFMFGDRVAINSIYTQQHMWYGSADYSLPIGYSGLRGNVGYAHTYYALGKEFNSLDAHGTADIASLGLSYPIVRSQKANLSLSAEYKRKWLTDKQDSTSTVDKKNSHVFPVSLNFDVRDPLIGGGVTYGTFGWSHGLLDLDSELKATDATTAETNGVFDKINLDVARIQLLPLDGLTLYGRAAGQIAFDNLDSSEDFGLGGPNGVRAYPTGEAYGDEGWLGQVELRYAVNDIFAPYLFYDYGSTKTNNDPWTTGDNRRTIGGTGVGLRIQYQGWGAEASAAWRTIGDDPESDSKNDIPMLWANVNYSF